MAENNNEMTKQVIQQIQDNRDPQSPIHHSHLGPILAVLIIMLVFIFGGLYLWGGMLSNTPNTPEDVPLVNDEPETPRAVADTKILETLSPSDELDAIEADIGSTNLDTIDSDLTAIDVEFDTALPQ